MDVHVLCTGASFLHNLYIAPFAAIPPSFVIWWVIQLCDKFRTGTGQAPPLLQLVAGRGGLSNVVGYDSINRHLPQPVCWKHHSLPYSRIAAISADSAKLTSPASLSISARVGGGGGGVAFFTTTHPRAPHSVGAVQTRFVCWQVMIAHWLRHSSVCSSGVNHQ